MTLAIGDNLTVYDMDEIDGIPYHLLVDDDGNMHDLMTDGDQDAIRNYCDLLEVCKELLNCDSEADEDLQEVSLQVSYARMARLTAALAKAEGKA